MRTASLLVSLLPFIPVGCISSVKPLATDDIAAFDGELIGEWVNAHPSLEPLAEDRRGPAIVTADGRGYKIETSSSSGEKESCSARLVQFGEVRILDCSLGKRFDTVPSHRFFRLSVSDDTLTLYPIDPKKFREVVKSDEPSWRRSSRAADLNGRSYGIVSKRPRDGSAPGG